MSLKIIKLNLIFSILILLTSACENEARQFRCIWEFLNLDAMKYIWRSISIVDDDIDSLPKEEGAVSKIADELPKITKELSKVTEQLNHLKKCPLDDHPTRISDKCPIENKEQSYAPKLVAHNAEIEESIIQKHTCVTTNVFDFKSETNINIKEQYSQLRIPLIMLCTILLIAVSVCVFIYKVSSNNIDRSEDTFDGERRDSEGSEASESEYTVEEIFNHLKKLASNAEKEFPDNEYVRDLSDAFLMQISNFIAIEKGFRSLESLTPGGLLEIAEYNRHLMIDNSGDKERKIHVFVNIDGVPRADMGVQAEDDFALEC